MVYIGTWVIVLALVLAFSVPMLIEESFKTYILAVAVIQGWLTLIMIGVYLLLL